MVYYYFVRSFIFSWSETWCSHVTHTPVQNEGVICLPPQPTQLCHVNVQTIIITIVCEVINHDASIATSAFGWRANLSYQSTSHAGGFASANHQPDPAADRLFSRDVLPAEQGAESVTYRCLTLESLLLPYGYSYNAPCARPG